EAPFDLVLVDPPYATAPTAVSGVLAALAIEAISRGADAAVLVERDPAAVAAITENLAVLGMSGRARVLRRDVAAFLAAPPAPEAPFDLVLVDPPYATAPTAVSGVLAALAMPAWVTADATVVVEGPAGDGPSWPPGWVSTWHRCYGDTLLCFGNTIEEKP
ncbi:MAG: RsmD family RNA methyltransferase, partial [Acidimicrobiia bacterium]